MKKRKPYLYSFATENVMLCILFVLSVWIMIKNSEIPCWFCSSWFVDVLFIKPTTQPFLGIAEWLDLFSSAYITSLLFYLIVEYIPEIKKKDETAQIVRRILNFICERLNQLIQIFQVLQNENFEKSDQTELYGQGVAMYSLVKKDFYVKCLQYKNVIQKGNIKREFPDRAKSILEKCKLLNSLTAFSTMDQDIINAITTIQLSPFLDDLSLIDENSSLFCVLLYKDTIEELKKALSDLAKKVDYDYSKNLFEISTKYEYSKQYDGRSKEILHNK